MIVYWSKFEGGPGAANRITTGLRSHAPVKVYSTDSDALPEYSRCPAYTRHLKNLFYIPAPVSYDLEFKDEAIGFRSTKYDQNFFNNIVDIRDIKSLLINLGFFYNFVPESDDLEMSQMPAYLHKNKFIDNTMIIPGTFNVGIWPRPIHPSFHMTNKRISFEEGNPLYYVKFYTEEKIVFKEYAISEKIHLLLTTLTASKDLKQNPNNLSFFYSLIKKRPKFRDILLSEVKKNLLE